MQLASVRWAWLGRAALAGAVVALGAQILWTDDFLRGLQPVPGGMPGRALLAELTGAATVAAGVGLLTRHRRFAARVLTALWWLQLVALHVPQLVGHPRSGGAWTVALEVLAISGAAAAVAAPASRVGRLCYALTLPAFGALHFLYLAYVESVIPAWLPGHAFWAVTTGIAHIAAGAAIVLGPGRRLAATLAGAMFGSWVVILHLPRALTIDRDGSEWTSLFIALAMCGGAWLIAGARYDGSYDG